MDTSKEYREHAEECLALARNAQNEANAAEGFSRARTRGVAEKLSGTVGGGSQ